MSEVDPEVDRWRRSTYSAGNSGCIELCDRGDVVKIRDSKNVDGPVIVTGRRQWLDFVAAVCAGEFDHKGGAY